MGLSKLNFIRARTKQFPGGWLLYILLFHTVVLLPNIGVCVGTTFSLFSVLWS